VNLVEKKASGGSIQSTSKAASDKQKLSYMISLMLEHIMVFPITDALCNTLFDIMLGRTGPKQVMPAVDLFFLHCHVLTVGWHVNLCINGNLALLFWMLSPWTFQ
jgi:hypothetical protein